MNDESRSRNGLEQLAIEQLTEAQRLVEQAMACWRSGERVAA
ncbi:hypothetical protein [Kitasatospora griseola]